MLNGTVISWWDKLDQDEKDLLITVLYDMSLEEFKEHRVGQVENRTKENKYVKI